MYTIAYHNGKKVNLSPKMLNRHGLITGATGTGKTVTLKRMVEIMSDAGVPCFVSDIKGDLSGFIKPIALSEGLIKRNDKLSVPLPKPAGYTVDFYDVYGQAGKPITASVSSIGDSLLSQALGLNNTQQGVLSIAYWLAEENNFPFDTLADLRSVLLFCSDNAQQIGVQYGSVSKASIGAIQRNLMQLLSQQGDAFIDGNDFDLRGLIRTDDDGKGVISLLNCIELIKNPKLYAVFLMHLLESIYNSLPERGDADKPVFCLFFDEAHYIFSNANKALIDKITQVIKLIRSKGVGIYFCSQSPSDIPDSILGQLGNRIQHALRAYTPKDAKAVRIAAQSLRKNPNLDTEKEIQSLAVGQALVSVLDDTGTPGIVQKAYISTPRSQIAPEDVHPEDAQHIPVKPLERLQAPKKPMAMAKHREQDKSPRNACNWLKTALWIVACITYPPFLMLWGFMAFAKMMHNKRTSR